MGSDYGFPALPAAVGALDKVLPVRARHWEDLVSSAPVQSGSLSPSIEITPHISYFSIYPQVMMTLARFLVVLQKERKYLFILKGSERYKWVC